VSITVSAVNDAPVAQPLSLTTAEDTAAGVTLAGTDVDGDPLSYSIATPPAHGALTGTGANRTYTPAADFNGSDSFTFTANDGTVASAVATITVTVTPVNDPPVAQARSVSTKEGTAVEIALTGTDADGDPLTYALAAQPAHGTVVLSGATVTYTPTTFFTGADGFTFTVSDGTFDSAPATVSVAVSAVDGAVKGGCSCGLTAEGAPLGALLLGLLGLRRRRAR
jgi:MYXO-CTERM domain-containing protein